MTEKNGDLPNEKVCKDKVLSGQIQVIRFINHPEGGKMVRREWYVVVYQVLMLNFLMEYLSSTAHLFW